MIEYTVIDPFTKEARTVKRKGRLYPVTETYAVELFTVRVFAEAMGRKNPVIRDLEIVGLPLPMFKVKGREFRGHAIRYYSGDQVLLAHLLIDKYDGRRKNGGFDKVGFIEEMKRLFYLPGLHVDLKTRTVTYAEE